MCVQLDLFSGHSLQEPIEVLSESEFQEMAQRADIADEVINYDPCRKCRYSGLCDSDECAMKGFKLDTNRRYKMSFYEWSYR